MIAPIRNSALMATLLLASAGAAWPGNAQDECTTEADVTRTNKWSSEHEVARYVVDEVKLLIALVSAPPDDPIAEPGFDTIVFWKSRTDVPAHAKKDETLFGVRFKDGCAIGQAVFVKRTWLQDAAEVIERYRQSPDRDIRNFLPDAPD